MTQLVALEKRVRGTTSVDMTVGTICLVVQALEVLHASDKLTPCVRMQDYDALRFGDLRVADIPDVVVDKNR